MEKQQEKTATRTGAMALLLGSICMLAGAAIGISSGTDLDQSLYDSNMAGYLGGSLDTQNLLILNLSLWILGVALLGAGAAMTALLSRQNLVPATLVKYNYWIAVPLVLVSYMAWLAVVVRTSASASPEAAAIAETVGWFAVRADWVGTVLVLGTGPVLISSAGKGIWVPNWLRVWSFICLFARWADHPCPICRWADELRFSHHPRWHGLDDCAGGGAVQAGGEDGSRCLMNGR
ncbi:MAG: hypothetical protein IPM82_30690 [Saprospiraceae bacterium]|nr:hypothetical protein [Saprospiraceae bacterium]